MKIIKIGKVNDSYFYAIEDGYGKYIEMSENDIKFESPDAKIYYDSGVHTMPWNEVIRHYCDLAANA
ncbi:MAG: hypothetical protein IPM07_26885 [Anaerolineales bacterium]|nr:hypothetical protein [Anaerolineales bacterium]